MISLEVRRSGSLHIVCDDDKVGSLEVYTMFATMISLEVWRFTGLHVVCDDDKFGSSEIWKSTYCM